jgi:hypothetical protein
MSVVYRPKDQGGLSVYELHVKNSALLGKLLFNLLAEDGVWQTSLGENMLGRRHCPGRLKTWGLAFLGRSSGYDETLLLLWIFLD